MPFVFGSVEGEFLWQIMVCSFVIKFSQSSLEFHSCIGKSFYSGIAEINEMPFNMITLIVDILPLIDITSTKYIVISVTCEMEISLSNPSIKCPIS